jgi:sporulation protein YlmC with PRC-barrel domain
VIWEDLHEGVEVYSTDGHKVGTLRHVVVGQRQLRVTHLVVDIGFHGAGHHVWEGGHGLTYDREIPVATIKNASDTRLDLRLSADEVRNAPKFTEEYTELPASMAETVLGDITGTPTLRVVARLHEGPGEEDIAAGAHVWREEPHQKLGEVDRVLVDEATEKVKALVVKRGFLRVHDFVLPMHYVQEVLGEVVRVRLSDTELADLKEYPPAE